MAGKVVWITGASSGIGRALAVELARMGAVLVLSSRDREALESTRAECGSASARHIVLPMDLGGPRDFVAETAEVVRRLGKVDVLIQNAGISNRSNVCETSLAVQREIMAVNYLGPVALTQAVLPLMLNQGHGHIVVVSSVLGKFSVPGRSAYSASKHALHGYFDALRYETETRGIRVTIACPGFVRTRISLNARRGDGSKHGLMDPDQERGMSPEDCARRIVRAFIAGQREVVVASGVERFSVWLSRYFPWVLRVILRKRGSSLGT